MTDRATQPAGNSFAIQVWDPLVRIAHWLLLGANATALITRGEPETIHQWAGYIVAE